MICPQEDETHGGLAGGLRAPWPGNSQLLSTHSILQRDCGLKVGISPWPVGSSPRGEGTAAGPSEGPLGVSSVPRARVSAAGV